MISVIILECIGFGWMLSLASDHKQHSNSTTKGVIIPPFRDFRPTLPAMKASGRGRENPANFFPQSFHGAEIYFLGL